MARRSSAYRSKLFLKAWFVASLMLIAGGLIDAFIGGSSFFILFGIGWACLLSYFMFKDAILTHAKRKDRRRKIKSRKTV